MDRCGLGLSTTAFSASLRGEIKLRNCGHENCAPMHRYGPAVRDYHLLHVVQSGCGVFENAYGRFPVSSGQGFMIFPGEVTVYAADRETPWVYDWVGFSGQMAAELAQMTGATQRAPVLTLGRHAARAAEMMREIYRDTSTLDLDEMAAIGGTLRLFAWIRHIIRTDIRALPVTESQSYYQKAKWYMEAHLLRDVKITEVASFVGLSRSQLFRIIVANSGMPPKRLLMVLRLQQAETLLKSTNLPLKAVALSAGFSNAARMGNVFRAERGMTPTQVRRG